MKLFATVLAGAATVVSTPVAPDVVYNVQNFQASCIPHSATCRVAFDVWQTGGYETAPGVHCEDKSPAGPDGTMTNLYNGRCQLSARTFNLTFCDRGATLRVTGPVTTSTNLTGETLLPLSDWKTKGASKAKVMTYSGPTGLGLVGSY